MTKKLTKRQEDVATLLKDGASNKKIAAELGISVGTVDNYVSDIYDALEIENRGKGQKVRVKAILKIRENEK